MKLWQAMLVAGSAWLGTVGALRAEDVGPGSDAPPADAESDAVLDAEAGESTAPDEPSTDGAAPAGKSKATAPAGAEVEALIKQLGADDFRDREAAVAKLRGVGERALPALKRALADADPEVASRADAVVRELERPPQPARLPRASGRGMGMAGAGMAGVGVRVHMAFENGKRRVEVQEPGRTITINEGNDGGIQMSVTGQLDGKEVTREFRAASPDELRTQNAEAFELYDRFAGRGAGMGARAAGGRGMVMPGGLVVRRGVAGVGEVAVEAEVVEGPNDIRELREMIERQMEQAEMPDRQRREIGGLLEQLRDERRRDPLADEGQVHRQMDQFNRRADALRDRLKALKLPDPGDALPPPAGARLGIEVLEDPEEGVTVLHVIPDGRAEKLGVEPLDVITKINGKAVTDAKALRRAVTEAKPPLLIEGTRDGEPLKLEEKPAAEKP